MWSPVHVTVVLFFTIYFAVASPFPYPEFLPKNVHGLNVERVSHNGLRVQLETDKEYYDVLLEKVEPTFIPDFKFGLVDADTLGQYNVKYIDIPEHHVYMNQSAGVIIGVDSTEKHTKFNGFLGSKTLFSKDGEHYIGALDNNHLLQGKFNGDYIIPPFNFMPPKKLENTLTKAVVELAIVVDYKKSQVTFEEDYNALASYLAVYLLAVNNLFTASENPGLEIKVTGAIALTSRAAQAFMENNLRPGSTEYNPLPVLEDFSVWVAANRDLLPPHDVVTLITDETMKDFSYLGGEYGVAYLRGACFGTPDKFYGTSLVYDGGRGWRGIRALAHQIGHNLGAPQDGDEDASSCAPENGFLMGDTSYLEENKFYFSLCSKRLIMDYINTPRAACLQTLEGGSHWDLGIVDPGQLFTMDQQCQFYENSPSVSVNTNASPDSLCLTLNCKLAGGSTRGWSFPALDGSACGDGNRCSFGKCV